MKIAIIGRTQSLMKTAKAFHASGHEIALIVTSKESPDYKVTSDDFKSFAQEVGCIFVHDPRINKSKLEELIPGFSIDIAISINYSGVIDNEVIEMFPLGILNAHGGDLPRYRGNACQAWAIINGEDKIGLCLHRMIGGELDSGDILMKAFYPIDINSRVSEVNDWFEEVIPAMFLETLEKLSDDPDYILESQTKDPSEALRCYPRMEEDGAIEWRDTAENILRLINASSEPYAGAFAKYKDQKVIIWRAALHADDEVWCGIPGQVVKIMEDNSVLVLTGKGKLRIHEMEMEGLRERPGNFIKSVRTRFKGVENG